MSASPSPPRPVVGVLGGMGPAATVEFMRRIVVATPASDDRDHIHLIVDQNPAVPSRLDALLEPGGQSPERVLADMARTLERAGATMLAMPCNTAHLYATAIASAVAIPLLNLIEVTARHLGGLAPVGGRIGVLASPATVRHRLFEKAFAAQGLEASHVGDEASLTGVIKAIKAGQIDAPATLAALGAIMKEAESRHDFVLIACTEFSILAPKLSSTATVIDALDILVDNVVAAAQGGGVPHRSL